MSNYNRGRELEYRVKDFLTDNGYWCIRAASSKGIADLVAMKAGETLMVSCKTKTLPGPAERVELVRVARMVGAVPIVATRGARGTGRPLLRRLLGDGSDPKGVETFTVDFTDGAR